MNIIKQSLAVTCLLSLAVIASGQDIPNRLIDYEAFAEQVRTVGKLRKERRVTEAEFIEMAKASGTIVLDARSKEKYDLLHVKGALHLSFPDMTATDLAEVIPSPTTRILIYCNNNFLNARNSMMTKVPTASLNIHSFNALHSYGYTNIYELGPLLDIRTTRIEFEGSRTVEDA